MSPDSPDAPMMEPHPTPPNCPDEADPGTVLAILKAPDQHSGDYLIEKDPPGDMPS